MTWERAKNLFCPYLQPIYFAPPSQSVIEEEILEERFAFR
jgi:hypothetical protein